MKYGLKEGLLEKIQAVFESNPKVDKVLLFGSRAKGNYKEGSDIDLAVKGVNFTFDDLLKLSGKLEDLNLVQKIDLLDYAAIREPALTEHIDRVGVEVYSRWKELKLGDVAEIQTGPFGSQLHASDYVSFGTPSIMPTNIGNRLEILTNEISFVDPKDIERLKRYTVKTGDIVYSRRGDVEKCAFITANEEGWLCGTGCLRIRFISEKVLPKFCAFYLTMPEIKSWVSGSAVGTTMPNLNSTILKSLPLLIPPLPEQKTIADTLTALDDKIDLLNHQNKTLEQLAETLFRQWFVEEAEQQSENQIEFGTLIDSVSITHKFPKSEVLFLNTSDIYLGEVLNIEPTEVKTLPGQAKKSIRKGDILFSEIRPANGRFAYIDFNAEDYVVSTKLMVLRSKGIVSQEFVYFYLTHPQTVEWLQLLAESRSGTFPQITFEQLRTLKVNIPSQSILDSSILFCEGTLLKIKTNQAQIHSLTKLRDTLLPKLMSGEVRIKF